MAPAPAIELDALTRRFGERTVLRDVSLRLAQGSTLAVLGRNGAGKSTLLRVLATLLAPHGGTVNVVGNTLPKEAYRVRGKLGFLAHEPLLYRDLTGRENLLYHARLHRVGPERVDELLQTVQLGRRADEPVRTLSRGTVQRLAICRVVLHRPELLLLDEPLANLDPGAAELVEPLLGRSAQTTRVMTSHDPEMAVAQADLVLGLQDGRVAFLGPPQQLDPATIRRLYA